MRVRVSSVYVCEYIYNTQSIYRSSPGAAVARRGLPRNHRCVGRRRKSQSGRRSGPRQRRARVIPEVCGRTGPNKGGGEGQVKGALQLLINRYG